MDDDNTQTGSESDANRGDGSSDGSAGDGSARGTQAPEGFVPQSELSAVEERRRAFQAENDRLKSELAAARAASSSDGQGDGAGSSGEFDPEAFRRSLLTDVMGATAIQTAAAQLRTEFPEADPALFTPERLASFGSPDALRLAASDSHSRVASAVERAVAAKQEEWRAEAEAKYGSGAGSQNGGGTEGGTGDPTPAQLAEMSMDEMDALEKANPGVLDRVLRSALTPKS
jgi:hypothetical protein